MTGAVWLRHIHRSKEEQHLPTDNRFDVGGVFVSECVSVCM
jgi:hypothetical protein